jgi:hypothetical protein
MDDVAVRKKKQKKKVDKNPIEAQILSTDLALANGRPWLCTCCWRSGVHSQHLAAVAGDAEIRRKKKRGKKRKATDAEVLTAAGHPVPQCAPGAGE